MSASYEEILQGLMSIKTSLPPEPSVKTRKHSKTSQTREVEEQVRATLLQLMSASDSDSVRVSAARTLMDKLIVDKRGEDDARQHEDDERAAAIIEARALLAELAERISGGAGEPVAMAGDSAPEPDHAAANAE